MKKSPLSLISIYLILFQTYVYGQKITQSEQDKFTKQYLIGTNSVKVKGGLNHPLFVSFNSIDSDCFITIAGKNQNYSITQGSQLLLLFATDTVLSLTSPEQQSSSPSLVDSVTFYTMDFRYYIKENMLNLLSKTVLKSIRLYTVNGKVDFDVDFDRAGDLMELATKFHLEYNKKKNQFKRS